MSWASGSTDSARATSARGADRCAGSRRLPVQGLAATPHHGLSQTDPLPKHRQDRGCEFCASWASSAQSSMCVGGLAKARSHGCWSGPIKSQVLSGTRKELAPLYTKWGTATQRCQVPSGWTGPSHLLITGPPYWQPAPAGGAEAISSPAISTAASPPTMQRFVVVSCHIAAGALPSTWGGKYRRQPSQQPMTLRLM
jgi:hypothetical protein